jgi:hypothetical protein
MLLRETIAVYCDNRMKQTSGKQPVGHTVLRASQRPLVNSVKETLNILILK